MPAPARKGFRPSWLGRAARAVVGEPERPRPRTWPDVLGAALLIPLGVSAAVTGFVFRHARWEHYLIFEGLALAAIAGGLTSLKAGAMRAVSVVMPLWFGDDETAYPTVYSGFPFLAFGLVCMMLAAFSPPPLASSIFPALPAVGLTSCALFFFAPLGIGIVRWRRKVRKRRSRRPRKDGEPPSRPPSDSGKWA